MIDFSFEKVKMWIKQELVLTIALLLGCVSSFFNTPKMYYIDWDVLAVLWALMVVVAGLKTVKFLDWTAIELLNRCATYKQVVIALVGLTFVSSMFVTNDVALLTFVPLALVIGKTIKMDMPRVVILQTLAANLGSMFTPPGNPQNLFLYAHYGYSALGFFKVMLLPTVQWRDRGGKWRFSLPLSFRQRFSRQARRRREDRSQSHPRLEASPR